MILATCTPLRTTCASLPLLRIMVSTCLVLTGVCWSGLGLAGRIVLGCPLITPPVQGYELMRTVGLHHPLDLQVLVCRPLRILLAPLQLPLCHQPLCLLRISPIIPLHHLPLHVLLVIVLTTSPKWGGHSQPY